MRALIQRVTEAQVKIEAKDYLRKIGPGLVLFLGIGKNDTPQEAGKLAEKAANIRIFPNSQGKFDKSLLDIKGEALVVSQFTLYGDASKGRRPDFTEAAPPEKAKSLYETFIACLRKIGIPKVEEGEFQSHMQVMLVNDGPVTVMLEAPFEALPQQKQSNAKK